MRTLVALLGLAVLMAVFAGVHYAQDRTEEQAATWAFQLAPGEVRSVSVQPSLPGSLVVVELAVQGSPIDVYTMESAWAAPLARDGLQLDRPFSYHKQWSRINVTENATLAIVSDGQTWHDVLLDNSDNYYDGDATPNGTVFVDVSTRFVAEEGRSLVLGYLATVPSILLVTVLVVRKLRRRARERAARVEEPSRGPPAP